MNEPFQHKMFLFLVSAIWLFSIKNMLSFFKSFLNILLILVLSQSLVQGAVASFSNSIGETKTAQQEISVFANSSPVSSGYFLCQEEKKCNNDLNFHHASSHCVNCALEPIEITVYLVSSTTILSLPNTDESILKQQPDTVFRPPKI